ncbi:Claudin-10 [Anabarilius grahami]|uniref:Claudin-10 n=1 Tax=Anabarilius grahami TaxID=495550 RepID=A0A3N0Y757_ANAGA|nr:Claudin-10 [Anabarilius grahami]
MKIRAMQIWGFLLAALGWIFVSCTMAMEGWKISSIGGQGGSSIMSVGWYWSSLWRACFTDSASTSNCYDFPVLWSVEGYLQIVRALLMSGMAVGMLGFILSLVGMECTYIGGKDREKNRSVLTGGICHVTSGMLAASGYAVYAQHVSAENFSPRFDGLDASALSVPVVESNKALRSSQANISIISELSTKSNISAISELSSKSETSATSNAPSKNTRTSRTGRPSRSKHSDKSRGSVRSEVSRSVNSSRSPMISRSHLNSKKVSSPTGATTHLFIKNSYL